MTESEAIAAAEQRVEEAMKPGVLLTYTGLPLPPSVHMIYSFADACRPILGDVEVSSHVQNDFPSKGPTCVGEGDIQDWVELRDNLKGILASEVRKLPSNRSSFLKASINATMRVYNRSDSETWLQLGPEAYAILGECHADATILFQTGLLKYFGQADPTGFGDLLYHVYRAGGWPCGWRGMWSGIGSMRVFWPHEEEPLFE